MILKEIKTINYRNLIDNDYFFNEKVNIFIGNNGHGKTNLLEAIYLLSLTKSFKTNKFNDISQLNAGNHFNISGEIVKFNRDYFIDIHYQNNKKEFIVNNNKASKFKDVLGLLNVVLFVPEDLLILKLSPSLRRKLMDIELSKLDHSYLSDLSSYYQVLKQRNLFLKDKVEDSIFLDTTNSLLEEYGIKIINKRQSFLNDLSLLVKDIYKIISNSEDDIEIVYQPSLSVDTYASSLKESESRDKILGHTNYGIHKDDFKVLLNKKDASIYASQGEQRTIVLSIKLGIVDYIYKQTNDYPILLLDDVLSELDDSRQANLINYINKEIQTFITSTSLNQIDDILLKEATIFDVNKGIIERRD